MSLIHPIAAVENVLEEYSDHLRTEFRARNPDLQRALQAAMERPHFLAQEPFYQAHRPFLGGAPWSTLGLDARLARAVEAATRSKTAYFHQSEAITHLRTRPGAPLVVTTGTGSGKTECFLLPVLQNAIEDAVAFTSTGLTALLVYPMNALANDQERRIGEFLKASGYEGVVTYERYDRRTDQAAREKMRKHPPHILLTNYMMLEYLLVRPADREALFANHRCRFLVLDEVHSYRGSLGTNIALLLRRLQAHLQRARQDWSLDRELALRRPALTLVATSATIKSVDEDPTLTEIEVRRRRDAAVQGFVGALTGTEPAAIRVIGEVFADIKAPQEARWTPTPAEVDPPKPRDAVGIRRALAALAGLPETTAVAESARHAAVLWHLGALLRNKPMSLSGIVAAVLAGVPERKDADPAAVRRELGAALFVGAAIGDVEGALRLRTHRFIRGGWKFHRCLDPKCGSLFAKGETECEDCGTRTAPLLLCRACGADALHLQGAENPADGVLEPSSGRIDKDVPEWIMYCDAALEDDDDDGDDAPPNLRAPSHTTKQMKQRPVLHGSFDPATRHFVADVAAYPVPVTLAPARSKCLGCGTNAAPGTVLTPVTLGTSAAVRVLAEGVVESLADQHRGTAGHDGKERVLIFADSRQDAAHQARFISYAGRFDRMRRRVVEVLDAEKGPLPFVSVLDRLLAHGLANRDNPQIQSSRAREVEFIPAAQRTRALFWEEAPLLDDLAISAGFRATLVNLGLVGVRYHKLEEAAARHGAQLAARLGITTGQLVHLGRCLLDEMRSQGALSRPLLMTHPKNPHASDAVHGAAWERKRVQPVGFPCDVKGDPLPALDRSEVEDGIHIRNAWRRAKAGKPPRLQAKFERVLARMSTDGRRWDWQDMLETLQWLQGASALLEVKLAGWLRSSTLLQVNAESLLLELVPADQRRRCSVCNVRMPWAEPGSPCPACHGTLDVWPAREVEANRYVRRIRSGTLQPLIAEEHTAQVTSNRRSDIEGAFNAPYKESPINVLACSPTLEMGIDIAGLDAVLLRNVPPRPDNYAQRGGRAGRQKRIGIVLGYARSTPHDQYFYDKPEEMIAGQVAAPPLNLANRDVLLRHLTAIAFGAADPGLAGRMAEYVTLHGTTIAEPIAALQAGLAAQVAHAADLALAAWGPELLARVNLGDRTALMQALERQLGNLDRVFEAVAYQVAVLQENVQRWFEADTGPDRRVTQARVLARRLLGLPPKQEDRPVDGEADDRGAGHPMRRLAEFGLLPGYEFPSEPATVRLLRDDFEDEPVSVVRRFGLVQYQPEAPVHARGHRWRVIGLDMSSPWNRRDETPWYYRICAGCELRYDAQSRNTCPRCDSTRASGKELPAYEFGGFLAVRDDAPVLEEEDRFSLANRVRCLPQWDGHEVHRARLPTGWQLSLRHEERVRWLNEGPKPKPHEEHCSLHKDARGFDLCPSCGRILDPPAPPVADDGKKQRKKPRTSAKDDGRNHDAQCARRGVETRPLALTTCVPATTLRIIVDLPADLEEDAYRRWGLSLGFALRTGMRHVYMLDGPELEFELEPFWEIEETGRRWRRGALTFIDPAVGGSGFLDAAARDLQHVARRALDHLQHDGCETACYRCLKSYQNQRYHDLLSWPHALPDLEILASAAPEPLKPQDRFDPRPWLEAYAAKVGSPLEHDFLRLFERHDFRPDPQVPIRLEPSGPTITVADFAVERAKLAIYIDGAAFHTGPNLRRDRRIRLRLQQAGWRVEELTARDLARGAELVTSLRKATE